MTPLQERVEELQSSAIKMATEAGHRLGSWQVAVSDDVDWGVATTNCELCRASVTIDTKEEEVIEGGAIDTMCVGCHVQLALIVNGAVVPVLDPNDNMLYYNVDKSFAANTVIEQLSKAVKKVVEMIKQANTESNGKN